MRTTGAGIARKPRGDLLRSHLGLGKRVALKFMLPGKGPQDEQHARFLREARAAVTLKTKHVAQVIDVGTLESGAPYMVMEYLDGRDLEAVLRERGRLPIPEAVGYVLQACEAVAEAHAAGIIHRDLKPANLFLSTGPGGAPCIKVLDFGVAKFSAETLKLTQEDAALGSPLYMSPEQMKSSATVDARSDLWALAVVLYELCAGKTPFHADRVQELCARVWFGPPTSLRDYLPDAPAGFEEILMRCLEKDRDRRFANVAQLAAALAPYAAPPASAAESVASVLGVDVVPARSTDLLPGDALPGSGSGSVPLGRSTEAALASVSATGPVSAQPVPKRRRRLAAVALVAAVVAVLAGVAFFVRTHKTEGVPAPAVPGSIKEAEREPPASTIAEPATTALPVSEGTVEQITKPTATTRPAPRDKAPMTKPPPAAPSPVQPVKPPGTIYNL